MNRAYFCAITSIPLFSLPTYLELEKEKKENLIHPIFSCTKESLLTSLSSLESFESPNKQTLLESFALLVSLDFVSFASGFFPKLFSEECLEENLGALAHNLEKQIWITKKFLTYSSKPRFKKEFLPKLRLSEEESFATLLPRILEILKGAMEEFDEKGIQEAQRVSILEQEEKLKVLYSKNLTCSKESTKLSFLKSLASWACIAYEFPQGIREYYKELIIKLGSEFSSLEIPLADLEELLESLVAKLTLGSGTTYSHYLVNLVQDAIDLQKGFVDVGKLGGLEILSTGMDSSLEVKEEPSKEPKENSLKQTKEEPKETPKESIEVRLARMKAKLQAKGI